jgi:hypothetical protein
LKPKTDNESAPAPQAGPTVSIGPEKAFDWKGELRELKETFDAGLLPENVYNAEVAAVMRKRSEMR